MRKKRNGLWLIAVIALCAVVMLTALFYRKTPDNKAERVTADTTEPERKENREETEESGERNKINTEDKETAGSIVIQETADASYEKWLAAAMVTAVSMQYPDFEIKDIYLTGETSPEQKESSKGAYVVFDAEGVQTVICSFPLETERKEAGTIDLYTRDLGFAAFDVVDLNGIDIGDCQRIEIDEISELISQSMLVSLYEH